jgi:hypothetical protein
MKWLKRGLWLIAWSVWIWLSFGLYRELPRQTGALVCRLSLGQNERIVGFLGDEKQVVGACFPDWRPIDFFVFNIAAGTKEPLTSVDRERHFGPWRPGVGERSRWEVLNDRNWVTESGDWLSTIEHRFPKDWWTIRFKDADTGRIAFREWEIDWSRFRYQSDNDVFVASEDGEVRRYPVVNWPLLVLCQTILALPLILLLAILRWRRKRQAVPPAAS